MEKDGSLFVKALGGSSFVKVLDYFIENDCWDSSVNDIAKTTGVSRNTVKEAVNRLVKSEMVRETRKVGQAKLFQLNRDSQTVQQLVQLDYNLSVLASGLSLKDLEGNEETVKVVPGKRTETAVC